MYTGKRIHDALTGQDLTRRNMLRTAACSAIALGGWAFSMRARAEGEQGSSLSTDITGDEILVSAIRPLLASSRRVAVAVIEPGRAPRFAGFGADENTEFEIGSVTKTFTGALLMDAVNNGVLTLDMSVQDILGDTAAGSAIANVRLGELASHTSGLPYVPVSMIRDILDKVAPGLANANAREVEQIAYAPNGFSGIPESLLSPKQVATILNGNPFAPYTPEDVIQHALDSSLAGRGTFRYSNLGVALQGHLIGIAQNDTWRTLLSDRVLDPLCLFHTWCPETEEELYAETGGAPMIGTAPDGNPASPWQCRGDAPDGIMRATAADLARYLNHLIETPDPAAAGLIPVVRNASNQSAVAVNWLMDLTANESDPVYMHTGETGGFSSLCVFQRKSRRGVVALSATRGDGMALNAVAERAMGGSIPA